jgi:hypothetical protein
VCLGELLQLFLAHTLLDIVNDIEEMAAWGANDPHYVHDALTESDAIETDKRLKDVGHLCTTFGFKALFREVERNREQAEARCSYAELRQIAATLKTRIRDEFEEVLFLWIEKPQFYRKENLFGDRVTEVFAGALDDVKEAATCYSLGRYTASVFHLQRVMEVGLKALSGVLTEGQNPNWDSVLKKIDIELRKDWQERRAFFQGKEQQISEAAAMLRAVKHAWRNPTMHVQNIYDDEKCLDVWNAVKGFMNSLCGIVGQSIPVQGVDGEQV